MHAAVFEDGSEGEQRAEVVHYVVLLMGVMSGGGIIRRRFAAYNKRSFIQATQRGLS